MSILKRRYDIRALSHGVCLVLSLGKFNLYIPPKSTPKGVKKFLREFMKSKQCHKLIVGVVSPQLRLGFTEEELKSEDVSEDFLIELQEKANKLSLECAQQIAGSITSCLVSTTNKLHETILEIFLELQLVLKNYISYTEKSKNCTKQRINAPPLECHPQIQTTCAPNV